MNKIDINIEKQQHDLLDRLDEDKVKTVMDRIFSALSLDHKEISLYFCDNKTIHELNKTYRNKDYATDVLSFESGEEDFLGDIAISVEKAFDQKDEFDSPTLDIELLRLLIHGTLHLLGYDHEKGKDEEILMKNKEDELMQEVEILTLYQK